MKNSASTIPVKVKHVRNCARANLIRREQGIENRLRVLAVDHVADIEDQNRSLLRRLGWRKKLEVPTVEELITQWKDEQCHARRVHMTEVWWAYSHTDTDLWRRIVTLSELPESKDNEVMSLSISDAELIGFNGFIHAVSEAISP